MYSVFATVLASVCVFTSVSPTMDILLTSGMPSSWRMEVMRSQQLTFASPAKAGSEAPYLLLFDHAQADFSVPLGRTLLLLLSFLLHPVGCGSSRSWLVLDVYRQVAASLALLLNYKAVIIVLFFSRVVIPSWYYGCCSMRVLPRFLYCVGLL